MRPTTPLILALLVACGGDPETAPLGPETVAAPAPDGDPAPAAAPVQSWKILAPSPLDLQAEVKAAGIETSIVDLVPTTVPEFGGEDKDQIAFRTGVVFAYTLLGGLESDKPLFLSQVKAVRLGMKNIGTGKGLLKTMGKAIEQIENDTGSRQDFLTEIDQQVSSSVPEEGWGPNDKTGPMLQAGAWLAGINVVAQAVVRADDAAAADKLLKRPEVADFFLKYATSSEGDAKAGVMSTPVTESLQKLKEISGRDHIGVDGAAEIVEVTQKLLELS